MQRVLSSEMTFRPLLLVLCAAVGWTAVVGQSAPGTTDPAATTRPPLSTGNSTVSSSVQVLNSNTGTRNQTQPRANATALYSLTVQKLNGEQLSLQSFRGKCLLVVNTASASILTQLNMRWLNELHRKIVNGSYAQRLAVLAVPSDTFGEEPLRETALRSWFELMGARFEVLTLTNLNQSPLFEILARGANQIPVFNNYNKYLVSSNGTRIELYPATSGPEENWQSRVGNIITLTGRIEQCVAEAPGNNASGPGLLASTAAPPKRRRRSSDDYWDHQMSGNGHGYDADDVADDDDDDNDDYSNHYYSQLQRHKRAASAKLLQYDNSGMGHNEYGNNGYGDNGYYKGYNNNYNGMDGQNQGHGRQMAAMQSNPAEDHKKEDKERNNDKNDKDDKDDKEDKDEDEEEGATPHKHHHHHFHFHHHHHEHENPEQNDDKAEGEAANSGSHNQANPTAN